MTDREGSVFRTLLELVETAKPDATDAELREMVRRAVDLAAPIFTKGLRKEAPRMLIDHRSLRAGFETRLADPWGAAFDSFETLYVAAVESGELYVERIADEANAEGDPVFTALALLHIRACHIASEIYALLRTGHASGALSRWRTLHEVAVVMSFLSERGQDAAERYLEHDAITSWHEAQDYQAFAKRLGEKPFSRTEMKEMAAERQRLLDLYGREYDLPWGWAAAALGMKAPRFRYIEEAVQLEHWRPHVRWASDSLHGGPKALFYRLGSVDAVETPVAGSSDHGLDDPGMNASISLSIATATLLVHRTDMEGLVTARVILELSRRAVRDFSRAGRVLARRMAEHEDESEEEEAARPTGYLTLVPPSD